MNDIVFRVYHKEAGEYCEGSEANMFGWLEDCQPVILEQFTGLTDKYGEMIFEGDVLLLWDANGKGVFFVKKDINGWGYHFEFNHVSGYECSTHIMGNMCVIGNINKNPELLEA